LKTVYKIETYTAAVLDHTITDEALSVYFKEILTSGVGHFSFSVPAKRGQHYHYDDIAVNDIVKIYGPAYNTVPANPTFIGRVGKISGSLTENGWIKTISGLSQGEILLRRFKYNKFYNGIGASTIVTEWATDLTLGAGEITADATAVTLEVATKSYFDLLQWISDYYDVGGLVQKDFYVDVNNNLVWKSRPLRSGASVETLTVGDNILNYAVVKSVDAVKNYITVYGSCDKSVPENKDSWTDTLTDWTATSGTLGLLGGGRVGVNWIGCDSTPGDTNQFDRVIPRQTIRNLKTVSFWKGWTGVVSSSCLRLHAPDNANYFEVDLGTVGGGAEHFKSFQLGPDYEYDAATNPDGVWTTHNSPNWWDIQAIEFKIVHTTNNWVDRIDGFYFYPERWSDARENPASYNAYGFRELEVTDDKLHSDAECEERARTLLSQLKDPPIQITVEIVGNSNVLVGDRLSMTIPAENISANYDVLAVEQSFSSQGYITKATMVDSANVREEIEITPLKQLAKLYKQVKALNVSELTVK